MNAQQSTAGQPNATPPDAPKTAPDSREDEDLARLCKALGHPARVRILRMLAGRTTCVCGEIVEAFDLAQSTVSEHLRVLKAAGLVRGEVDGPRTCYCVDPEGLARLGELVGALEAASCCADDCAEGCECADPADEASREASTQRDEACASGSTGCCA